MKAFNKLFWLGLVGIVGMRLAMAWTSADQHDIALMETRVLQHVYEREAPTVRLNRLEQSVFGQHKTGTPEGRLSALRAALPVTPALQPLPQQGNMPPLQPQQPQQTPQQQAASVPTSPQAGESDYPIVDEMERRVLGQAYPTEDLTQRVPRLEARVLGQPQNGDLGTRVDVLHDRVLGTGGGAPANANNANSSDNNTAYGDDPPADIEIAPQQVEPAVTQMEKQLFKQVYTTEPIESRLNRLEMKLFSRTAPPEYTPQERVQRIMSVASAGGQRPAGPRSTAANLAIQLAPILIMMLPLII
jgi:hypothetical protein